ncbi:haloacid dehalogenase-like hydrolase domain-containing 5 [Salarias fasciatus]|uniref:haloacid dehalogenase-like hydrolase domain-containing 5 n=1 Tax=Salarias fasciatus TaxID=181472 RepID=UPI00117691E2|nr:haloacid dehalogenase-like hydrolase domain-containing 5 [Salarias fasciatus]
MWRRGLTQTVGVFFDVDGVLLRGGSVLPAARRAFQKLVDQNQKFRVPVVFVTNAGSCEKQQKVEQLSRLLDVPITPEQLVLSYSPLQTMRSFHDKCVLVSGQGPVTRIANSLGFHKVLTIEQLAEQHPLLDMVDHSRRPSTPSEPRSLPRVEAIILLGEPVRWETNLQLLIDLLMTNGSPGSVYDARPKTQLPVLACNADLLWMAEAPSPRFGHGMFLLCLESVYRKLSGRELQYQALLGKPALRTYRHAEVLLRQQNLGRRVSTIYAVGDNVMTDIYGANLYNRYLSRRHAAGTAELAVQGTGSDVTEEAESASQCHSILVCTGVYDPRSELPPTQTGAAAVGLHRDLVLEPELLEPRHLVEDVEDAVDLLLHAAHH